MAKKSEDRRRSILNAALDEFEAKGFSAALVEDIAHRAGVSKGTIYGYFKGKEALLLGLAEEVAVLIQKEFDQPSEHASLPLIERLWRTEAGLLADNGHGRLARILRVVWSEGLHRPELTRPIYEKFLIPHFAPGSPLRTEIEASNVPDFVKKYPMVLMAPVMQGIFWAGIIDKVMPLNLEEYFKGYLTMIFGVQPQSETTGTQGTNDEAPKASSVKPKKASGSSQPLTNPSTDRAPPKTDPKSSC